MRDLAEITQRDPCVPPHAGLLAIELSTVPKRHRLPHGLMRKHGAA
jgi:hypothetical protein